MHFSPSERSTRLWVAQQSLFTTSNSAIPSLSIQDKNFIVRALRLKSDSRYWRKLGSLYHSEAVKKLPYAIECYRKAYEVGDPTGEAISELVFDCLDKSKSLFSLNFIK